MTWIFIYNIKKDRGNNVLKAIVPFQLMEGDGESNKPRF
jgi:hypothetical protein